MPPSSPASVSPSVLWVLSRLCSGIMEKPRSHNVGLWMMCSEIILRDMLVYGVPSLRPRAPWCMSSMGAASRHPYVRSQPWIWAVPCAHRAQQQLCPPLPLQPDVCLALRGRSRRLLEMMQSEQSPLVSLLLLLVPFSLMLGSATLSILPLCRGAGWGWEVLPSFLSASAHPLARSDAGI